MVRGEVISKFALTGKEKQKVGADGEDAVALLFF